MGAPKLKWSVKEEATLKAGVLKHGTGNWRTILKDPVFSCILCLRSNVDLKDKWRNMTVTENGCFQERVKVACRKSHSIRKSYDSSTSLDDLADEIVDTRRTTSSIEVLRITSPRKSFPSLDKLILEAITYLDPRGSSKLAIAMYIEDQYGAPQNFERFLSLKLKMMISSGNLIKLRSRYIITPKCGNPDRCCTRMLLPEPGQNDSIRSGKDDIHRFLKSQVDTEIAKIKGMTAEQAALAAAQAVAEAEAAVAVAEEAAREAEAAEADAEAAQAFAQSAMKKLQERGMDCSEFYGNLNDGHQVNDYKHCSMGLVHGM